MIERHWVLKTSVVVALMVAVGAMRLGHCHPRSSIAQAVAKLSAGPQGDQKASLPRPGSSASSADIDNMPGPSGAPNIKTFIASPMSIEAGKPTALQWTVTGATHIGLSPYGAPKTSSVVVTPVSTMRYVLAATNEHGTSTARLVVNVRQPKPPRTLHVGETGTDTTGEGSENKPWASVQKAVDAAAPGDTILIHKGNYSGSVRIRIPGLTLTSAPGEWAALSVPISEKGGAVVQIDPEAHETILRRLELIGGGYYSLVMQTTWEWGLPNNQRTGPGHVLIEDCHIHGSGRDVVKVTPGTDDVTIRRCTIDHSGLRDPSNAEGIDNVNGDRMVVEDTFFHDIATSAIYFKGGSIGSRIERSLAIDCGAGILLGFDTSPEYMDSGSNPGYFECLDCIARNNIVVRSSGPGIGLFSTLRAEVTHNTVVEAARKTHSVLHFGIVLHEWQDGIPCPGNKDPIVVNNIFALAQDSKRPIVEIRFSEDHGGLSGMFGNPVMAANQYYWAGGDATFLDGRPDSKFRGGLAGWQSHVASDSESADGNPKLDATWHLTGSSPCQNRARQGYAVDDYDGATRSGHPDIGADEAEAGPSVPVPPNNAALGTRPRNAGAR